MKDKTKNIAFVLAFSFCLFFSINTNAQNKNTATEYRMYGYFCSSTDTNNTTLGRLYSIEQFNVNSKLISRVIVGEKKDTIKSWTYDKKGRLMKETNKDIFTFYFYSGNSLVPNSCITNSYIHSNFPATEHGQFIAVPCDSTNTGNSKNTSPKAVQALMANVSFPNYPTKKICFKYTSKEKIIQKDEFNITEQIENIASNTVMQFNKNNQLIKYECQTFDYGGYNSEQEYFFYNKSKKITHAFGYYNTKTKDKPDYIICYKYQ
jgi:hypothetical protein